MRVVQLDASAWQTAEDVYAALLAALGAPSWHGHNLDALNDSLTGDLNAVSAPLWVEVSGLGVAAAEARATADRIGELFAELATEGHAVAWAAH
jgi:RNAse (barnase) inhibitor barstar